MADKEVKTYPDGTIIQEYPKWVRKDDTPVGSETLVNSKEEENKYFGNDPKEDKKIEDKKPKDWGK